MGGEWWGECPHEPMEEMHGSSTSTALRAEYEYEYAGIWNLVTGNWELAAREIVTAPIRSPLLFPFRRSAALP